MGTRRALLTVHATERYRRRVRMHISWRRIQDYADHSVKVPRRHARTHWPSLAIRNEKHACIIRCSSEAVYVCRASAIVTVINMTHDDLGTLLTWLLTGFWVGEKL